jgi:cell division protein FtsA
VATIPISIYNSVIKCVERCNVEVDKIFSTPLAASNVLFTQTEMDTGVCGIDIGGDMTTLVIFKNNVLQHICSVPFGGQVITKDIKTAFDLTHKQAEKIKIEYGNPCLNDNASEEYVSFEDCVTHQTRNICLRSLSTVIRSRLTEILNILHEQILLKYEHDEVSTPAGIVLFGGSSKMKGLVEFVKNVTKQYVRTGYITENSNTSQLPIDYVQSYGIVLDEIVKKNYCKNTNNVRSSTGYNSFFKYVFSKTKKMLTGI